jgi:predicted TIM-barrel fold metal-dependent hydrolase
MIVDAHVHAGHGDRFTGPWDTDAPLGRYLRRARAAGIERAIVVPAMADDYARANRALAAIVERAPDTFVPFAFVDARRDAGRIGTMIAEAVELGFRGIKVHGHDAPPLTEELCETARYFGLPVLCDVAGRADPIDLVAARYPDVTFIVPHLGSFADDWRTHARVIDQIARFPNVYADTSGVRRFDYLVDAVRRAGAHKLLFGSDGPWLHPGLELAKIRLLGLPREDEALVSGGNALRLLERAAHGRLTRRG